MTIENFVVATTVAFPKLKEKFIDEYPKIKLTEALLQCMVFLHWCEK